MSRLIILLSSCCVWLFAQPPAWLSGTGGVATGVIPPAPAVQKQNVITKTKTIRDTVVRHDTTIITDTLYIPPPKVLKYKYKLQLCNMDYNRIISTKIDLYNYKFKDIMTSLNNEEKAKNCYFTSAFSDSIYNFSYGMETMVNVGFIYDNYGNKMEQLERQLQGITLKVLNDDVYFDYLQNKKISIKNSFNEHGIADFYADYTISERGCNFWIFCNFEEKKQYIFLNIVRENL